MLKSSSFIQTKIIHDATHLYTHWKDLEFEERPGIVEIITNRITVGKTDINLSLS